MKEVRMMECGGDEGRCDWRGGGKRWTKNGVEEARGSGNPVGDRCVCVWKAGMRRCGDTPNHPRR